MKYMQSRISLCFGICSTAMVWCSIYSDVLGFVPHNDPIIIGRHRLQRGRWGMANTSIHAASPHLSTLTLGEEEVTVHPTGKLRGGVDGTGTIINDKARCDGLVEIDTKSGVAKDVLAVETEQEEGLKVGALGKEKTVYEGDYLVHEDAGICRFLCVSKSTDECTYTVEDVIQLEFRELTVHVLLEQRTKLTRFRGRDAGNIRLSRFDDYKSWRAKRVHVTREVGGGFSESIRSLLVGLMCRRYSEG